MIKKPNIYQVYLTLYMLYNITENMHMNKEY